MIYVIRGKSSGMCFESCEIGKGGQEKTYETFSQAEVALKQFQFSLPFEDLEIMEVKHDEKFIFDSFSRRTVQ